ncbi:MAG: sigma-70 family RNA polymerase sigma factor [Armatimonas sp.]
MDESRTIWRGIRRKAVRTPFEGVWQVERPRVLALAARLTGSPDDAEDVAQEVAVRALRGWDTFRGEANVRTWLYRITLNLVADRKPASSEPFLAQEEAAIPRGEQPEEQLLRTEGIPDVRLALDALPAELRTALVLHVYEELKCREIADLLGVPVGTVLSRLHTARKRMLELLKERNATENAL